MVSSERNARGRVVRFLTQAGAVERRETGLSRVERGADPEWLARAFEFIRTYCQTHHTVFCDDLWAAGLQPPREARALGPVMLRARREGLISHSGQYRPSVQSSMAPKPVWISLVCNGTARE